MRVYTSVVSAGKNFAFGVGGEKSTPVRKQKDYRITKNSKSFQRKKKPPNRSKITPFEIEDLCDEND